MNTETIYNGLLVSLYGLSGVFFVLILFYIITKFMVSIFGKYATRKETED